MRFADLHDSIEKSSQYLKLHDGDNRVRIVSEPLMIYKCFNKSEKTAKVFMDGKKAKEFMANTEKSKGYDLRQRYMMYVINRETKDIQQAEFGVSVISQIADLQTSEQYKFDTLPPYDITINKHGTGLETDYKVLADRSDTSLTQEEMDKVSSLEPLEKVVGKDAEDYLPF